MWHYISQALPRHWTISLRKLRLSKNFLWWFRNTSSMPGGWKPPDAFVLRRRSSLKSTLAYQKGKVSAGYTGVRSWLNNLELWLASLPFAVCWSLSIKHVCFLKWCCLNWFLSSFRSPVLRFPSRFPISFFTQGDRVRWHWSQRPSHQLCNLRARWGADHGIPCFVFLSKENDHPGHPWPHPHGEGDAWNVTKEKSLQTSGCFFFFGFGVSSQPAAFGKIRMLELTVEMPPCCFHRNGYTWKPIAGWCTLQPSCLNLGVRSDIPFTGRFFLNLLATKIHLQLGNEYGIKMETGPFLLLVFFLFSSHQNSWREHHHFFSHKRCKALNISGPFNVQFMSQASFLSGFPTPFFPSPSLNARKAQAARCVRWRWSSAMSELPERCHQNGELKAVKTKSGWKKRVVKMLEMSNFIQSSGSATLASCFFFQICFDVFHIKSTAVRIFFCKDLDFPGTLCVQDSQCELYRASNPRDAEAGQEDAVPPIVPYPSASGDWMLMLLRS